MDIDLPDELLEIREAVLRHCSQFPESYWLDHDESGEFPADFHRSMAEAGWLGIAMPTDVGGSGLGITHAAVMMQAVAEAGGGMAAASSIHGPVFSLEPVARFGTKEQQQRMIPPILRAEEKMCFGVTEPNTGLDTTRLKTRAVREAGGYRVNGEKVWITNAHVADRVMLLARTTPLEEVEKRTQGLSLFFTRLDRSKVETRIIPKMGRKAVGSNTVFINDLFIPEEDLIGAEGAGFSIIMQGLNPERILIAAEAIGIGRAALARGTLYAKERVVFGRPIGQNQAIQHPLAKAWMDLEAANLMVLKAAGKFDAGQDCGAYANAAKYLAAEAGFGACEAAVMTHGGMGYAKEYHVERYMREVMIPRLAPVSPQMILNFIAERVLGLPKSY